jgi:hypothetical protein
MAYVPVFLSFYGFKYSGTISTVQDLECDPKGSVIYAEGTIKSYRTVGGKTHEDIRYVNNRGYKIINGRKSYCPPFYKVGEEKACLDNLLQTMHRIGRQAT